MKEVRIKGKIYSISSFSKEFNFSPNQVRKLYAQGYRDEGLLKRLKQLPKPKNTEITVNGKSFKSKRAAANYYGIPSTTFYRHLAKGDIETVVKQKIILDKLLKE